MAKFKVGDRVRISPSSCHYVSGDNRNPKDLSGSITKDDYDDYDGSGELYKYEVDWGDGFNNVYRESDLVLDTSSDESLLEEARRRFKPGCKYRDTAGNVRQSNYTNLPYIVKIDPVKIAMAGGQGLIYDGRIGRWGGVIEEPVASKFKVGDWVVGNKGANKYTITKEGWVGYVGEVNLDGDFITISTTIEDYTKGNICVVRASHFDLYTETPWKHPYDNCVIEVLDKEHGKKVIEWWKSVGVGTNNYKGNSSGRFYGLVNGLFKPYNKDCGAVIITLPEQNNETKEAIINSQIKTKQNGNTKSGKTIIVQRVDLQIRKGSVGRRVGLKGSGIEISIGDRHRDHKTRSILG